jgi:hypothetical protein
MQTSAAVILGTAIIISSLNISEALEKNSCQRDSTISQESEDRVNATPEQEEQLGVMSSGRVIL